MEAQNEPIAIIGTGCRFPGSCDSPSKLWELLEKPRDLLKKIPNDRFSADGFYHPKNSHHGTSNVRHSYLLDEDLRTYDAQFFGVKAIEASSMDPQQRLLMETVYEALESAGLSIKQLQGSDTAVYVGVMSADFMDMLARDVEKFPTYFATGTARSILSNRLSYFYDWHGPSMTIDTACSSSLIALHQAVQVLRSKQSKVAVVSIFPEAFCEQQIPRAQDKSLPDGTFSDAYQNRLPDQTSYWAQSSTSRRASFRCCRRMVAAVCGTPRLTVTPVERGLRLSFSRL